jgi:hypothetical protein
MKHPAVADRLGREKRTIDIMIRLHCRAFHRQEVPCPACRELIAYAVLRVDKCPWGAGKPVCGLCPIHCWRPDQREAIRRVMRWAGPRMLLRHPITTLRHLADARLPAPALPRKP